MDISTLLCAINHPRFSLWKRKSSLISVLESCRKPIILEGKLSTDNWKYRLLTDGVLTKLQLLLHVCHIESLKLLIMFSRCIIVSHPDRCHSAAPNWKRGLQHPSHNCFCVSVTGGILLPSHPGLKRHSNGSWKQLQQIVSHLAEEHRFESNANL